MATGKERVRVTPTKLTGSPYGRKLGIYYVLCICILVIILRFPTQEIKFVEYQPLASNGETGNINKISTDTVEGNAGKALKPVSITTSKLIIDSIRQSVFQNIYKHKLWGKGGKGSGGGSSVGYTVILRKRLLEFITKHNFSSMADIPCGAMEWTEVFLKSVWQERPFFRYIGMDITKSVVEQLQEQWKGNDKVNIRLADLVSPLPNIKADFILTRDALQHIPLKDACLAIENIINLGDNVKYVLIGTYPKNLRNTNIKTGGYQSINVIKDPFNLPEPYLTIKEIPDKEQKYVYVFKMKDLQIHRCQICTAYVKRNKCS